MDDPETVAAGAPLPFYAAAERAVFELDEPSRRAVAHRVRRSRRRAHGWRLTMDEQFAQIVDACARPRDADDGVWITPRLRALYAVLHGVGIAHSFELYTDDPADRRPAAGIIGVLIGRAAMLESMTHRVPHAGNALLSLTLDALADQGFDFADIQLPSDHTVRLGARLIAREQFEARLRDAVS